MEPFPFDSENFNESLIQVYKNAFKNILKAGLLIIKRLGIAPKTIEVTKTKVSIDKTEQIEKTEADVFV